MSAGAITPLTETINSRVETKFRRGLWVASILAALAILACCVTMVRSQNEFAPAESVVSAQSQMLAHNGTLYYDLNRYPYTVCAYMPILYLLEAAMVRADLPGMLGARFISLAAFLGLIAMCWRLVMLYTGDRNAAWTGAILTASSSVLMFWGTIGQTDTLAVFFSITAFYQYSRYHVRGESTLLLAGLFAGLALFTKQTMISVPAATFVALWIRDKKTALPFGILFAAAAGGLALGIDRMLGGRFLADTIFGNIFPMSITKLLQQLQYFGSVSGCLLLVVLASSTRMARGRGYPAIIYLGFATAVFIVTAAKIGSDSNYQMETTVLLATCAAIGLHELDFFPLLFSGSKKWVTLLLLPLAVHAAVGDRVAVNIVIARWANENLFRQEIAGLRPFVDPAAGRVFSTDFNTMARLRGKLEVEPYVFSMLVKAGRVSTEPVRRDLAAGAFDTVILGENVFEQAPEMNLGALNAELLSLPAVDIEAIRARYRLVKHVPGPYMDGVYVYQPLR